MKLYPAPQQIVQAFQIPDDEPCYKIGEDGFFGPDDTMHDEGDVIVFDGVPSLTMIPMNQLAEEKILAYFEELDVLGAEAAKIAKRGYVKLADRLLNRKEENEAVENKGIRSLSKQVVPEILGKRKRGRPAVKKIGNDKVEVAPATQLGKPVEE